jgi:gluconate 2-dehydrogenase gamma chain
MSHRPTRRSVLASATIVPLTALSLKSQPAPVFSAEQLAILEAFADRLIPADETGPGARECGAVTYISNTIADFAAAEKPNFLAGLASLDDLARKSHDRGFAALAAAQQDEVLTAFEQQSRPFFNRVRQLTLEGMFSDPYYGGNREFRGWDLIRYPGPRLAVSPSEQKLRDPIKPVRNSAYGGNHSGENHGH